MDRLLTQGVSFLESYTADPLCSPARSSWFTSRMPSQNGVITNGLPIDPAIPNLGQWLGPEGYETVYIGKWHVPQSWPTAIAGFDVIPSGIGSHGQIGDGAISRTAAAYLEHRTGSDPFFLTVNFLQPHDVCQFVSMHRDSPDVLPYPQIAGELPPLPDNFNYDPNEPAKFADAANHRASWSETQWRYYLWSYYRQVEMVDVEIGRVLRALDNFGYADNTMIIFTSDHGEGRGRHQTVLKNFLYDEAAKVPLVISWPGHVNEGATDSAHLVSGLDIMTTVCDYAGVAPPTEALGLSLRPLLEGTPTEWRDFVAAEVVTTGRMIRTPDFKYITYYGDPVEQLFDMANDPGETVNLAGQPAHDDTLEAHRDLLAQWEQRLLGGPGSGCADWAKY
jgi:choline-sulfatase